MSDLDAMIAWVRGQIEADKAAAEKAYGMSWIADDVIEDGAVWILSEDMHLGQIEPASASHVARHDPRDVIARCDSDLAIIDAHSRTPHRCPLPVVTSADGQLWAEDEGPCYTLRLLAQGYQHRDGYRAEWRP